MSPTNGLEAGLRKVHKIGGSLMVALTPRFIEINGIQEGDELPYIAYDTEFKFMPGPNHSLYRERERFHRQALAEAAAKNPVTAPAVSAGTVVATVVAPSDQSESETD